MSSPHARDANDPLGAFNVQDRKRVAALRRRHMKLEERIAQNNGTNAFELREASALRWVFECLAELLELRELRNRVAAEPDAPESAKEP